MYLQQGNELFAIGSSPINQASGHRPTFWHVSGNAVYAVSICALSITGIPRGASVIVHDIHVCGKP